MSDTKKNALAELAERLETHIVPVMGCVGATGTGRAIAADIRAAQRIIAELAEVSDGEWIEDCGGLLYLCRAESRVVETTVGKCRAIAEEGDDNGK